MRVRPKLVVNGADRAIAFYREVLGAELGSRFVMGQVVVFAELTLPSGDVVQLKDPDGVDPAPDAGGAGGAGLVMDIQCADPDSVVAAAVQRGAEVIFPVADQPYGARQGRFRDPFGHQWIAGTPVRLSDDEVQGALDAWTAAGEQ